ncbi:MAG: DUF11 domain-containing protein, partial [Tannerella sp.]|nr:DUF11 domain-containing protein [Tannerella sp.]
MKSDKLKKLAGALLLSLLPIGITAQNNLISALQCSSTRPAFAFTIQEAWTSSTNTNIDTRYTPLAGDIDGDGNVEVFAANGWGDTSGVASILYVFEGKTGALAGQINCPGITTDYSHGALLFKRNASAKGTVFIAGRDGQIYLYEVRNSTRPLQFDLVWQKTLDVGEAVPAVADLNGDGNVELVAGKYIIDANTGNLLSTLAVGSKNILQINIYQSFPLVANVDGDSYPEVIVGTCVYKFNTGFVANPTAWRTCPRYGTALEGANMAADINQDGSVDIVNISVTNSSTCDVTVWTPATNTEIGRFSFSVSNSVSYPFVGDMDGIVTGGKKYPEICINTAGTLRAYAFNGTNFVQKWSMPHTDTSGATALTLFDFNNDGVVELVYRDETHLRIFDGSGNAPVEKYAIKCGSATIVETPIVADVTGDGSADIIVTGDPAGVQREIEGEVMVFEGGASKWASSPHVWNQQLYSNLLVNEDLTIPSVVLPVNLSFTQTCPGRNGNVVQYYNGGPMQAPYISEETYCPIDLSSDIFIVNGSLSILSSTTVEITITVGNQGAAVASSSTPIRFYQNSINTANVLTAANTTLGVDLVPGQTTTITRTITLPSIPPIFFARVLDDGTNFPALGAFSDCDLTNNTKSFGTLELTKEVDQLTSCLDNIRKFTVKIQNDGTAAYNNIQLIDSLGIGWDFISITPSGGTSVSAYNPVTRSITWTIPTLAPGDSTVLIILAQTTAPGDLRNYSWISSVGGTQIERDFRSAYTIVSNYSAPSPPVISPADTAYICPPAASVLLTASPSAVSYQWYKDGIPIPGATSSTYPASAAGKYSATLFDGTCTSNMSDTVTVLTAVIQANNDYAVTLVNTPVSVPILDNDNPGCCGLGGITNLSIVSATSHGTATIINDSLIYTPNPD